MTDPTEEMNYWKVFVNVLIKCSLFLHKRLIKKKSNRLFKLAILVSIKIEAHCVTDMSRDVKLF